MNRQPTTSELTEDIGETIGYLEAIVERRIQIAKLSITERTARLTASLATGFVLLGIVFIVFGIFSIALGFLIVEHLNWSYSTGFFAITTIYIAIGILLYLMRHQLFTEPISKVVIKKLYKNNPHDS